MIQSLTNEPLVLATNTSDITFANTDIRTRSANCNFPGWLQHSDGSAQFTILDGGLYKINFNANITSATTGVVALALKNNGVVVPATEVDSSVATADEYQNISFTKTIRLCPRANSTITVGSIATISGPGTATQVPTVKNVNISIERIA